MARTAKDVDRLLKILAADHGCTVTERRSGHRLVSRPGHRSIVVAKTPSDARALANIKGDIRRHLGITL